MLHIQSVWKCLMNSYRKTLFPGEQMKVRNWRKASEILPIRKVSSSIRATPDISLHIQQKVIQLGWISFSTRRTHELLLISISRKPKKKKERKNIPIILMGTIFDSLEAYKNIYTIPSSRKTPSSIMLKLWNYFKDIEI